MDVVCKWRYVRDALDPLFHIQVDGLLAQTDLNGSVRLRLQS